MVQSFGRRSEQTEPVMPPMVLPPVQIPAVLVLDNQAMRNVVDQIRTMVADAVRAGFTEALGEHDPEAAAVFDAATGGAEPGAGQLADLSR
jgi:hypothetical protein